MDSEKKLDTKEYIEEQVVEQREETEFIRGEDGEMYPVPTEKDWKELREVADAIPKSAFLVILLEFCERFTYYGLSGPFQNYIQQPAPESCKQKFLIKILPTLHNLNVLWYNRSSRSSRCHGKGTTSGDCLDNIFSVRSTDSYLNGGKSPQLILTPILVSRFWCYITPVIYSP